MPLEGIFIEAASSTQAVLPDLSLHISPPNTTTYSSSSATATVNDARFDLDLSSPRREADNNNSITSTTTTNTSKTHIDLSLGRLSFSTSNGAGDRPQNPYQQHPYPHPHPHHLNDTNNRSGLSLLDVSAAAADAFRPIKGIPVYHNGSFPFLSPDNTRIDHVRDPKMCFYQMTPSLSAATAATPHFGGRGGLDPMSSAAAYRAARLNGLAVAAEAFKSANQLHHHQVHQHQHHHHLHHHHNQYGQQESGSHGSMRARFLPKLPTKRSMRAPRMRWTSTLHARFVHAVELLGGHESK